MNQRELDTGGVNNYICGVRLDLVFVMCYEN